MRQAWSAGRCGAEAFICLVLSAIAIRISGKSYNIEIEAVATDGSRIDTDYIYANDLGAGQSQEFEIFTYVDDADLEAMQSATFEIIEASMY